MFGDTPVRCLRLAINFSCFIRSRFRRPSTVTDSCLISPGAPIDGKNLTIPRRYDENLLVRNSRKSSIFVWRVSMWGKMITSSPSLSKQCTHSISIDSWVCKDCSMKIAQKNEFLNLILHEECLPEFEERREGFEASFFENLHKYEANSFWFAGRNQIIQWALGTYAASSQNFLEIGCGTGYVLSGIAKTFPHLKLFGSDLFKEGLPFAKSRVPSAHLMTLDATQIPFVNQFDCIGAFDVIEHIKEDERALSQICKALKPGGVALITVPQHRWLWGPADERSHHFRRYTSSELKTKAKNNGLEVLDLASFVSLLLPFLAFSRFAQKQKPKKDLDMTAELKATAKLFVPLFMVMSIELFLIRLGFRFPCGGSLLLVARKPSIQQ